MGRQRFTIGFDTCSNREALLYSKGELIEEDKTHVMNEVPCKYQALRMFKHRNDPETESHFSPATEFISFSFKTEIQKEEKRD